MKPKAQARAAARLAAVQALYQYQMEQTPLAQLLDEFHLHRLGAEIDEDRYAEAETAFFDDVVKGVIARRDEIDDKRPCGVGGESAQPPAVIPEHLSGGAGRKAVRTQRHRATRCRRAWRDDDLWRKRLGHQRRQRHHEKGENE